MNIESKARRYAKERIPDVLQFERDLRSEENSGRWFHAAEQVGYLFRRIQE